MRSPRVATRLFAIILVPMLGLGLFAGMDGRRRWQTARTADRVQASVLRAERMVQVDLAVNREAFLLGAVSMGVRVGVPTTAMSTLIGYDLDAGLASVEPDLDRAFGAFEPGDPDAPSVGALHRAVEALARTARAGSGPDDLMAVVERSNALAVAALDRTDRLLVTADGTGGLRRDHAVVRSALAAKRAFGYQTSWAGLLFEATTPAQRSTLLGNLRTSTLEYDAARGSLDRLASGALRDRWQRIQADPDVRRLGALVATLADADADGPPPLSAAELGPGIGTTLEHLGALNGLAELALDQARAEAQHIREVAADGQRLNIVLAALLALATLAVVALIAHSIVRPIRRLATAAEQVGAGDLADLVVPEGGPPELRRVTAVLGEAVANLRAVETQVGALAAGDVEDAALVVPVPGRLGALVHESVARLSRSLGDRDELSRRLAHEASHDPLTQLPNRAAARAALSAALERGRRAGTAVAVLFVDLDGFKQVNDTHGHAVGDQVLTMTAGRLLDAVRAGDLVARIGGDEFVVIAEQSDDAAATVRLGERLVEELAAPITIRSIATRIGASVGIAFAVDGEVDPDGLLRDADLATYRAKLRGRGRVEPFDEELRRELAARVEVERALRRAIDAGELELHFQPVVSPDGTASSVEALVRWHHPDGRMVPPDDFIPVAEGSDLIIDLDRWVLGEACRQLASWADDPTLGALTVSVNLSGRHLLNLTVVDDVRRTLAETGADPASLVLEITETVILTDLPVVVEHLRRIRALGVRIAIDDFGTGYTSLTHLRSLPVDVVKIDRSMIVAELPSDTHVLKLLVDTVHALGLGLVAEGVETDAQLERLESLGCERVQGFLFSRAVPAGDLRDAVRAARRATAP
jgi:diguanylate cyclase (GGDEF)-like protein